ncbi:ROK family protein [Paenibacillus sp. CC-CFT747]|nr:ROK family protein [Paenibacillus sp. CC-CFT747]
MQKPFAGDHSLLKSINLTSLLDLIRRKAPISRAELAKSTRLTRATVSTLVEELIARHLVVETGTGESSGGRRPTMLEINRNAGYIAGVDLRAKDLLVLAVNLQGESVLRRTEEYERPQDEEHTRKQLTALIGEIRNELPLSPLGLCGVGVGIHGFVGHPGGEILFVPHFGWKRLAWKEALEKEWGSPSGSTMKPTWPPWASSKAGRRPTAPTCFMSAWGRESGRLDPRPKHFPRVARVCRRDRPHDDRKGGGCAPAATGAVGKCMLRRKRWPKA